jgi:hypothetical protein
MLFEVNTPFNLRQILKMVPPTGMILSIKLKKVKTGNISLLHIPPAANLYIG